jgi:hypothetical protein
MWRCEGETRPASAGARKVRYWAPLGIVFVLSSRRARAAMRLASIPPQYFFLLKVRRLAVESASPSLCNSRPRNVLRTRGEAFCHAMRLGGAASLVLGRGAMSREQGARNPLAVCRHDFRRNPKLPPRVLGAFEFSVVPWIGVFEVISNHKSRPRAA